MKILEECQHDLLLVISGLLFILFTTGMAVPSEEPVETEIIPT